MPAQVKWFSRAYQVGTSSSASDSQMKGTPTE